MFLVILIVGMALVYTITTIRANKIQSMKQDLKIDGIKDAALLIIWLISGMSYNSGICLLGLILLNVTYMVLRYFYPKLEDKAINKIKTWFGMKTYICHKKEKGEMDPRTYGLLLRYYTFDIMVVLFFFYLLSLS